MSAPAGGPASIPLPRAGHRADPMPRRRHRPCRQAGPTWRTASAFRGDPGGAPWMPPYRGALEVLARDSPARGTPSGRGGVGRISATPPPVPTTRRESRHDDQRPRRPPRPDQGQGRAPQRGRAGRARPGRAGRRAPLGPRRVRPRPEAPGPDRPARAPGKDPRARAGADPLRAHAGLALHLLPRRGPDHGQRPRHHARPPTCASSSAATPTSPTSASSAPPSGAWTSTSTTSTRPCRARSSGTSSAWRPASRWPAATGASPTPTGEAVVRAVRGQLPQRHGRLRRPEQPGDLLRALRRRRGVARYQATVSRKMLKRAEKQLAKARTKDSMQALERLTHEVDGEPRISADPPLIVPIADLWPADQATSSSRTGSTPACASTGAP